MADVQVRGGAHIAEGLAYNLFDPLPKRVSDKSSDTVRGEVGEP